MDVWQGLVGQQQVIDQLRAIAHDPGDGSGFTHAWLFTGPAGSGRSNVAHAFATALLCPNGGCGECRSCVMADAGTHPDLRLLKTDKVIITIDDVRELVVSAQLSPSIGRMRVQLVEDADRMTERTSNVLLKALEEPPAGTVWILCAPSEADLLPTIRSRVRTVRLVTPSVADVGEFIARTTGVDRARAEQCARLAQCHIGMARRLATDADAWQRRGRSIQILLSVRSVSDAAMGAAELLAIAQADSAAFEAESEEQQRGALMTQLGLNPDEAVPAQYRAVLRGFADDTKRRATRSLRDGVDRILTDLLSAARDTLLLSLGNGADVINREHMDDLTSWAAARESGDILRGIDAITGARTRIMGNVTPLLAFESMLAAFIDPETLR